MRRSGFLGLGIFASIIVIALAPSSAGAKEKIVDHYCSPSGDYCTYVFREHGRIKLTIRTFSFTGPYTLCVKPPGECRECNTYRLTTLKFGIKASRIDFARNYFHRRGGSYSVSWHSEGFRIGPSLHFRRR
jgi:hypothetical protein